MADFAASAPLPPPVGNRRASDINRVDKTTELATSPLAAHGGQARSALPLGVDDMAAGRLTPGAAIEAQRAHLAAVARDMDVAGQRDDGTIQPRFFTRRFPVVAVLIGVIFLIAALALF